MAADARTKRVMRGTILKLTYQKHERQETRFMMRTLMAALDDLAFRVYEDLVMELLQDLGDRGYLRFTEIKDRKKGTVLISEIQLTPAGRNIVERINNDPAVDVE